MKLSLVCSKNIAENSLDLFDCSRKEFIFNLLVLSMFM